MHLNSLIVFNIGILFLNYLPILKKKIYLCGKYETMDWKKVSLEYEFMNYVSKLNKKKQHLDTFRPIPSYILNTIKDNLNIEWTYNSNNIEGNTLTLLETRMVLEEGITVKGKSLREHFEVVNHQEAIEYVEFLAKPGYKITEKDILEIHSLVLNKIEKDFAGRLRTAGVRITGANFIPPNAYKVPELLTELLDWTSEDNIAHFIAKVCVFHHRFVWIHPFFDGNGRTARLLTNLLLMKEGFPPAIILSADRKRYYEALNLANEGNYSKLMYLIAQALDRSLTIYLSNLDDTAGDFDSISNIIEEPSIPYGQEYVSLLARKGKIEAYKENGVWFTKKSAIEEYQKNRKRIRK